MRLIALMAVAAVAFPASGRAQEQTVFDACIAQGGSATTCACQHRLATEMLSPEVLEMIVAFMREKTPPADAMKTRSLKVSTMMTEAEAWSLAAERECAE